MAYVQIANGTQFTTDSPPIYFDLYYDSYRSLNSMFYKIKISIRALTSPYSFPPSLNVAFYLDNYLKLDTVQIKNYDINTWSSPIVYESSWYEITNKISGTTKLDYYLSSPTYSGYASRRPIYTYYLPIEPSGSVFTTINNFTVDSSYGVGTAFSVPCTKYYPSYYDVLSILIDGYTVATRNNYTSGNVTFTNAELTTAYTGVYARMAGSISKTFTFQLSTYTDSSKTTQFGTVSSSSATGTITTYTSTITSIPNFNIDSSTGVGVAFPVYVSKYTSSNYDVLTIKIGSNTVATRNNFLSGNVTFSNAELTTATTGIYARMSATNSTTFTFTISTYTNSSKTTLVGTNTLTSTGTLTTYLPVLSSNAVTHLDSNSTTVALTGDSSKFILGYSDLQITVTSKATTQNYATLGNNAYVFEVSGKTTQYANESDSLNFVKTFTGVTVNNYNVKVIDSRTNQLTISKTLDIIPYTAPAFSSISVIRQNGNDADVLIEFTGTYTDWVGLTTTNSIQTAQYRYREVGSTYGDWNAITLTTNTGGNFSKTSYNPLDLDVTKEYDFEVQVIDKLGTTTQTLLLSSATPTMCLDIGNKLIGVGKVPNDSYDLGSLDLAGSLYVDGTIYQNNISILNYTENTFGFNTTETITNSRANLTFDTQTDSSNSKVYLSSNHILINSSVKIIFITYYYVTGSAVNIYPNYGQDLILNSTTATSRLQSAVLIGDGSSTNLYMSAATASGSTTITNASTYFKVGVIY